MGYKYENDVVSELEQMGVDYQSNGYFNMSIEVEEVYAKAKAFDGIINIKYDFVNYHGLYPSDEDYIKELEDIIRKYMEDK